MPCQDNGFHCRCYTSVLGEPITLGKLQNKPCCHCGVAWPNPIDLRYAVAPGEHGGGIFAPAKPGDAGYDLATMETHELFPGQVVMVNTGVSVELPCGFWGLVKVRSSIGMKGILLASSGVIDTRYRGVIKAPLINVGQSVHTILAGARVAQLILLPLMTIPLKVADAVASTERGSGGFGSTGI